MAERALKIAMIVTETLVRKDFALDPDENNMKKAAFHMVRAATKIFWNKDFKLSALSER